MDDLVTWLRAQLDDDERLIDEYDAFLRGLPVAGTVVPPGCLVGEPFDVDRQRAEVDAKRRIIDRCAEVIGDRDLSGYDRFGSLVDEPNALALFLAVETMRDLALPLADQPGYRDEWKP